MPTTNRAFRLAALVSGGGTTLKNLIEKIEAGSLGAEIALVVSSSPAARGLQIAAAAGIPAAVAITNRFPRKTPLANAFSTTAARPRSILWSWPDFSSGLRFRMTSPIAS